MTVTTYDDRNHQPLVISRGGGSTEFVYDDLGRPIEQTSGERTKPPRVCAFKENLSCRLERRRRGLGRD